MCNPPLPLAHCSPPAPRIHPRCFHLPITHHQTTPSPIMRHPPQGAHQVQPIHSLPSHRCHLCLVEVVVRTVGTLQTPGASVVRSGYLVSPGRNLLLHLAHPRDRLEDWRGLCRVSWAASVCILCFAFRICLCLRGLFAI
jgi:hypothetical protein